MDALALFNKLFEPNCFAIIFLIPATSKTVLTAPPAITPDPSIEGRIITLHAPKLPVISCEMVKDLVNSIVIKFFLASVFAFLNASITSSALATPIPTLPFLFPLIYLPPFVTLDTRLTLISRSSYSVTLSLRFLFFFNLLSCFKSVLIKIC